MQGRCTPIVCRGMARSQRLMTQQLRLIVPGSTPVHLHISKITPVSELLSIVIEKMLPSSSSDDIRLWIEREESEDGDENTDDEDEGHGSDNDERASKRRKLDQEWQGKAKQKPALKPRLAQQGLHQLRDMSITLSEYYLCDTITILVDKREAGSRKWLKDKAKSLVPVEDADSKKKRKAVCLETSFTSEFGIGAPEHDEGLCGLTNLGRGTRCTVTDYYHRKYLLHERLSSMHHRCGPFGKVKELLCHH